ncbi:MAG: PAS domain-containing protein [Candidatus Aquilonibacter sp.]
MADAALRPDLSLVLERITDGFFALDAQWRISYINAQARKLLHARAECVGEFWLDVFPKARGRLFEREYHRAMRDQRPVQFVEYSATAELWFEVKAYPSPDGLSVYFRDVTSRIEAQREVERTTWRQQALIDFGRAALAGATYDQTLLDGIELLREILDASVIDLYQYDRSTGTFSIMRSEGWETGAWIDPHQPPLEHIASVVRTGEPFVCSDLRIDPRARSLAQLERSGVLSCVATLIGTVQAPIGAIVAYNALTRTFSVGDVRFVQSLSQSIAEFSSALESNRLMSEVLESIHDAFVAVDGDLRITYVNGRMARYWEQSPLEIVGTPLSTYTDRFDTADGRVMQYFKEALRERRSLTFEYHFRGRWHETRLYPFGNGVAGYVRDITARKNEQERVLELNAELERRVVERTTQLEVANKELESFSYSVSHDLRAPLRAIDGFSQAMLEDYGAGMDQRAQGYLERVRRAAQRMADLIDALLQLSKVARAPMAFAPIDLSAIAGAVAADLGDSDSRRSVKVIIEPGLAAHGEPHLIQIVLANLLGNAWKFTRHVERPQVYVGKNSEGEFYVRDNGAGFEMTYAGKLFGAFARLHPSDEYEGTGIGLATVARIIHRHGGSIRAEGVPGGGATFYFTLPAKEP